MEVATKASAMNIYQKLAKIRELCEVFTRNKRSYTGSYTTIDEILAKVTAGLKKYNVSLIPMLHNDVSAEPYSYTKVRVTKTGDRFDEPINEMFVKGHMHFEWINDENPDERICVPWYIAGTKEDPSQAFGSAMTYAMRYFLLDYFQIATLDDSDPDSWKSKQKEAEDQENKVLCEGIIDQVLAVINARLEKNPNDRDKVVEVVKKYAKDKGKSSSNPKVITDPVIASKLLEEINEKFGMKE